MAKPKLWWLAIGLGLLIGFIIWCPLFTPGMPYTHDGENHLARFANYYLALKEGQLPPRFAPNLMNRYGYPVFNYNYPLANIWSVPLTVADVNLQDTFKILSIFTVMTGSIGVWVWLRNHQISKAAGWLAVMAYWSAPYVLSAVFFRGSIGEVMVYGILPWLFWWLGRVSRSPRRMVVIVGGVLIALLLLAHNVTGLIGLGAVSVLAIVEWGMSKQIWKKALLSLLIGLGLSLWFWLPAIAESNQVVLLRAGIQQEFLAHLVSMRQLVTSPLTFGFSTADPVDSLSMGMGTVTIFTLWASILLLIVVRLRHSELPFARHPVPIKSGSGSHLQLSVSRHAGLNSRHSEFSCPEKSGDPESSNQEINRIVLDKSTALVLVALLFTIGLLFFQSTYSASLWSLLPLAQIIQFPWRLMLLGSIMILPVLAWVWDQGWWTTRVIVLFGLVLQMYIATNLHVVDRFHKTNQDYFAFTQSTSTQNENRPVNFTYQDIGDWQPTPTIWEGEGDIEVITWNGSSRQYQIDAKSTVIIVEPTANFLGWQSHATDLATNQTTQNQLIEGDDISGRVAYRLESGSYVITTKFTQQTLARYIGNGIFLVTMAIITLLSIQHLRNRNRDLNIPKKPSC